MRATELWSGVDRTFLESKRIETVICLCALTLLVLSLVDVDVECGVVSDVKNGRP